MVIRNEQKMISLMLQHYPYLENNIHICGQNKIIVDALPRPGFVDVYDYLIYAGGFHILKNIIGISEDDKLILVYSFANDDNLLILLKEWVDKDNPIVGSVINKFPQAEAFERDLREMFGIVFDSGSEDLPSILPDNWPSDNFPLRKEWQTKLFDKTAMAYDLASVVNNFEE